MMFADSTKFRAYFFYPQTGEVKTLDWKDSIAEVKTQLAQRGVRPPYAHDYIQNERLAISLPYKT